MSREVRTVKTLTTYYEIETLCEGMIADFSRRKQYTGISPADPCGTRSISIRISAWTARSSWTTPGGSSR